MVFGNTFFKMKKEEWKIIKNIYMIFFCLMLLAMPIIFAWHIEIGWEINNDIIFTNGWYEKDIMKVYHTHLYALLILNGLASGYILYGLIKK